MPGDLAIVSLGPGAPDQMTPAARGAIERADVILGYRTYLDLIPDLAPSTPREGSGMRHEVQRVQRAVELSAPTASESPWYVAAMPASMRWPDWLTKSSGKGNGHYRSPSSLA